ncbi:hypothetical protein PoB_002283500 [Plakobranchus ocellatus]|uniref:Uncharacterized protein n=1 Tax=Plakobranchus ocellatus TaxID=259542 RepID=A0AAV3ZMH0_9GAST|nr:hypothetical protein PoB_002283500 [Plakobranchus ocellatus]
MAVAIISLKKMYFHRIFCDLCNKPTSIENDVMCIHYIGPLCSNLPVCWSDNRPVATETAGAESAPLKRSEVSGDKQRNYVLLDSCYKGPPGHNFLPAAWQA